MVRKVLRAMCVISLVSVMSIAPTSTWALGGSDADPTNQIGEKTQKCQAAISKLSRKFAVQIVKGLSRCFDEVIRCDQTADAAAHDECIGKLLIVPRGRCALGKLGGLFPHFGETSASSVDELSHHIIGRAYFRFIEKLEPICTRPEVDLSLAGTGLGPDPTPPNKGKLAEALNSGIAGRGIACSAHRLLNDAYPMLDEIIDVLLAHPDIGDAASVIFILGDDFPPFADCR